MKAARILGASVGETIGSPLRYWLRLTAAMLVAIMSAQMALAEDGKLETVYIGTDSYYVLRSEADWNKFRQLVIDAKGGKDVNAIMDADFTVSTFVGLQECPYRGTFDGNGYTLTVNISTGQGVENAAPFSFVSNSTFRNLHVAGRVFTWQKYAAGMVSRVTDGSSLTVEKCRVSVVVFSILAGDGTNGGIVSIGYGSTSITVNNCMFDGEFLGDCHSNGGIVGYSKGKVNISNCFFAPRIITTERTNCDTWVRFSGKAEDCTLTNNHCTQWYDGTAGDVAGKSADEIVALLGNGWTVDDEEGKPVPKMELYPSDVTFETYDMIPGTESGEEGKLKIPFSCNNRLTWLEGSYTDENGKEKKIERTTFGQDTYVGFICVPATEQHKNMKLNMKLYVGRFQITIDDKQDAILHRPEDLTASVLQYEEGNPLTDAGAVLLKWKVKSPEYKDILEGDEFLVMRSLTGMDKDAQLIGSVTFDPQTADYSFKDSTVVGSLSADYITYYHDITDNVSYGYAMPRYVVIRASARELWGISDYGIGPRLNAIMKTTHLLNVTSYTAHWEDEAARTVGITWKYGTKEGALWDSRAQMKIRLTMTNRDNVVVDTTTYVLTADEMTARRKEIQLTRSCVDYKIEFCTEEGTSPFKGHMPYTNPGQPTFYYESLGQIVENSLQTRTLQSSVLLTWEKTEDTVDFFRVERRNTTTDAAWEVIAPQVTECEYEDRTVSPIFDYEYRVSSVNQCEGLHETTSIVMAGNCVKTGRVEGYVRFADGTGVPGVQVTASQYGPDSDPAKNSTATTDESGFYSIEGLNYWGYRQGAYQLTLSGVSVNDLSDDCSGGLYVTFDAQSNYERNRTFTVTNGVRFTGLVMYEGTSIPVKGARFLVDGREVRTSTGSVETDFEGKFAFRMLRGQHTVQAVMNGHSFTDEGCYIENNKETVDFQTDASAYFYDQTQVKLIGRVAGGHAQGDLPLGNSLSTNNLGDSLKIVLTLEGDNASWLVFDNTNRALTTRDVTYQHHKGDNIDSNTYATRVHTERHRMVIYPDPLTGEYEVMLPPVKWKVLQITAQGYATLFQDGQTSDVIDLTDSLTEHRDILQGQWRTKGGVNLTQVEEVYYAKYSRIYHSPVLLEYRQQGFDKFDYFGEKNFSFQPIGAPRQQIPVAYGVTTTDEKTGRDITTTHYTFGHPVFSTDRGYELKLSAIERYYYNNVVQSDRVDVVKLDGGFVTIRNGLMSGIHRDTLSLDSLGEAGYTLRANRTPYLLTGKDALCTVTFTMERDGTTFEGKPLQGYVFSSQSSTGAQDIVSVNQPILVDILRDPPGGGSSAKLTKGSTLKLAYQMDMAWKGGVSIGINAGTGLNYYTGLWSGFGAGLSVGQILNASSVFNTSVDVVFSGSGQRAFSYTMTAGEDISTDAGPLMAGADADLYMGMETNMFVRPAVAIQAVNDSVFRVNGGARAAGRMVEIASGRDENDSLFHLVRTEVLQAGQNVTSTFVHSQQYLVKQLIPGLVNECRNLMFTGTMEEAQAEANRQGKRIYLSLVPESNENRFGVVNTDQNGNYVYHTTNANYQSSTPLIMNYVIVLPSGDDGSKQEDIVHDRCNTIGAWVNMIALNEKEKLGVTKDKLMKNFDIDGGSTVSYSEDFSAEYSNTSSYNWMGTDFTHNYFANPDPANSDAYGDKERAEFAFAEILGSIAGKFLAGLTARKSTGGISVDNVKGSAPLAFFEVCFTGVKWNFSLSPVAAFGVTPKNSEAEKYSRKESFTVKMDKKSHLDFDVYYSSMIDSRSNTTVDGLTDVFVEENFLNSVDYVQYFLDRDVGARDIVHLMEMPRGFIYRTRGGATVRPWEPARTTLFERTGTTLDERTKKIENPIIKMDRQSLSGVPHDEPARFKLYMTNESEQPEAISGALLFYTLYADSKSNPKGARMTVDGMPLTADGMTVKLQPGEITEKTLEVWAGEDFDYDNLEIGVISQGDVQCFDAVRFSVHFLPTAGNIQIASPGDKWIMNTDAPYDARRGWYMPVIISGFNKNQRNFDHIEFQYKENTRGDDYWTNLCGYYADSTLYRAATGTKEMIPENGNIVAYFYGDGTVMEKAYDIRARLFCRNGSAFITSDSKVLTGIKDTRRPQLFGQPEPKDGIVGAGDNIVLQFSEAIEHNYLQQATNFEVVGETNETALSEEPSLLFSGTGYAETDARRNFANKNMTIDLMVRPDLTDKEMPLFSHGSGGSTLQLWLTKDWKLRAVVDDQSFESRTAIRQGSFQQVALILDNDHSQALLYNDSIIGVLDSVSYNGYGPLVFGATNEVDADDRQHYSGRMLEARLWNRAMTQALLNTYGKRQLTGYEMGLADYYPMNEGENQYAVDKAQGANAKLYGVSWAQPRGMSLHLDFEEQKAVKGMQLEYSKMSRSAEQDYTLMFWFKTDERGQGALLSNGSGKSTDDDARNKFFVGFEQDELIYRTNGRTLPLGKGLADDDWHHFAITVDRSHQVANFYVDHALIQSISTDTLGGMMGRDFYVGNMVWHEAGADVQTLHAENALTGRIDELCLFSQALPPTLMRRYSTKSPTGREKGLLIYMGFNRQERQQNNNLELKPYALNQRVETDMDGNETNVHDSVFAEPVDYVLNHIDQAYGAPVQTNQALRNLNFSFVGRDNQLLVNIDELDSRVNKRNLFVTVTDIPDLNGNYMASPATMEFFIDRNPLRWERRSMNLEFDMFKVESDDIFEVTINNISGASHTYTIDNLPRWLTVNKQTDIIGPRTETTLTFTVSKDLNVGTYDEIIYLTDENGLTEPMTLTIRKNGTYPGWSVDEQLKRFSMNLVGQVKINSTIVTDPNDVVAAFDAKGRCLGLATVSYNATTSKSQLFMTIFNDVASTTAFDLNFKLWHHETGQILGLKPDRNVSFRPSTVAGSVDDPIVMTAGTLYYQEVGLMQGWNWISFNVDNNSYRDAQKMLNQYEWHNGDIVTDDTENITLVYNEELGTWLSNDTIREDYRILPERSYRIYVHYFNTVEIPGNPLKSLEQRKINVSPEWNSIGYTPMVNLPVATALADYDAADGDVVKSREEFAIYTKPSVGGGYWSGSLQYMKPGQGYMLYRNSKEKQSFHYPYYEPGSNVFEQTVARAPAWQGNFSRNMSVVATAEGIDLQEGDRLLAFCKGELRGEAVVGAEPSLFFLTVAGDAMAPVTLAVERDGKLVAVAEEAMTYVSDSRIGTPEKPTAILFQGADAASDSGEWYSLEGYRMGRKPSHKGIYIYSGKKFIVK